MSPNQKINAEKITKPIQLLAVWFTGLVLLEGILFTSATLILEPVWIVPVIVISAILIIPLFLYFIFLLQTKYRAQMQEDTFYSKYLDTNTNKASEKNHEEAPGSGVNDFKMALDDLAMTVNQAIESLKEEIKNNKAIKVQEISNSLQKVQKKILEKEKNIEDSVVKITLNRLLPNSADIRLALLSEGFKIDSEWEGGSGKPPKKALITFDRTINPDFLVQLLKLLREHGLGYVNMLPGQDRNMHKDEFIIGSYAFDNSRRRILVIDDVLIRTLESMKSKESMISFFE